MTTQEDDRPTTLTQLASDVDRASTPLARLQALRALLDAADTVSRAAASDARAAGTSWGRIGETWGLSKQGAAKHFTPAPEAAPRQEKPSKDSRPVPAPTGFTVTTPGGRTLLRVRKDR